MFKKPALPKPNLEPSTIRMLLTVWPLMFGIAIIMVSSGLQGTLLGLRAEFEEFPHMVTGVIMAMYYCGFLAGCKIVPSLIGSVGHVRVFAALASIASTTILLHGLFVNPITWITIRLVTGFCFSGIFIIAESWLNKIASNTQRGKIFAAYVFVVNGGLFAGQFFINLAPVSQLDLFITVSVLISLALAPITLTNTKTPAYEAPDPTKFSTIFKRSPLAMCGVFIAGLSSATVMSLGPVYASLSGMDTGEVSLFMAIYILGNAILPLIFGALSDRIDRRKVIIMIGCLGITSSILMALFPAYYFVAFFVGGSVSSLYSVSITHMQDRTKSDQIVSSSRSLILFNAIGAIFGPLLSGYTLGAFGVGIFFAQITVFMTVIIFVACYRMVTADPVKAEKKKKFVYIPTYSTPSIFKLRMEKPNHHHTHPETPKDQP